LTAELPACAHELTVPGLLTLSLKRDPYLVFYFGQSDHVDAWRACASNETFR
jgi:toxin ParE1/3/4